MALCCQGNESCDVIGNVEDATTVSRSACNMKYFVSVRSQERIFLFGIGTSEDAVIWPLLSGTLKRYVVFFC